MPGLGKTTLAKKVHNHPLVRQWFDKLSWCVISQTYTRRSVLIDISVLLESELDRDRMSQMGEEGLAEKIHKTLKGKRYLIVMDDVWDSNAWDDLQLYFPDDGNGSRILLTTRNKDVVPPESIVYAFPSLSNDQCWELLKKKVFGNETCPLELIANGTRIAEMCHGLPLVVVVIAGVLLTMHEERNTWQEVGDNLASYIFEGGDNIVTQILELSYKHLPQHLKHCFLYFIAFPEDREIPIRTLMMLWISEGFVHEKEGKTAEDVAEEYLTELIDRSLVVVSKRRSDGGVKACVIHDLLRDLCLKICEEENFLKEKRDIFSMNARDLAIHGNHITWIDLPLNETDRAIYGNRTSWSYCQQVRSLHGECEISYLSLFRMRLLRVLHFHAVSNHLIGIRYMVNLRYLVVRDLPWSIGNLVNLEYLRVETHDRVYLPQEILRMMKLRYIRVRFARYCRYSSSFQTNNLAFLSVISIRKPEDEEMLKYSPNLRTLKCVCKRKSPPLSSNFDLRHLIHLESLRVGLYGPGVRDIGFPSNIRKLSLYGCELPWEKASVIGRLEKLEVLKLALEAFEGERWDTRDGEFQTLKFLKLDRMRNLIEWNVESSGHFPRLRRLVLNNCSNLEEVPCEIGELATLEMIEVKGECKEALVESAKRIQHQQFDMGNEGPSVVITSSQN